MSYIEFIIRSKDLHRDAGLGTICSKSVSKLCKHLRLVNDSKTTIYEVI